MKITMSFKIAKFSSKSTLTAKLEVATPNYCFDLVLLSVNCSLVTLFYEVVNTLFNQILLEGNVEVFYFAGDRGNGTASVERVYQMSDLHCPSKPLEKCSHSQSEQNHLECPRRDATHTYIEYIHSGILSRN